MIAVGSLARTYKPSEVGAKNPAGGSYCNVRLALYRILSVLIIAVKLPLRTKLSRELYTISSEMLNCCPGHSKINTARKK